MSAARARRRGLVAILSATFAHYLTITILTVALRPIADAFESPIADAAWLTLAPALVSGLLTPAMGRVADTYGRLRTFRIGVVLTALGTLGSALAPSMATLVASRVLTGIGTALSVPSGLALATSLYGPEEREIPVGLWTSVTALAPALGVLVGGAVVEHASWRLLFFGQLPFSLLAIALSYGALREQRATVSGRFDAAGASLLGTAVFALTLVANRGGTWGFRSFAVLASLAGVALALSFLVHVERRASAPVLPLELLADPVARWAATCRSLVYGVHMGSFVVLPLYLMDVLHLGPGTVALLLLPRPIAMGVAAPVVPRLARLVGRPAVTVLGAASMLVGSFTLVVLGPATPYPVLLLGLLLMGSGLGVNLTTTAGEVTARSRPDDLGATSALLSISTAVSGALGTAVLLAIATDASLPPADAYHAAFDACAVLAAVALLSGVRFAMLRRLETVEAS